jgi:prevent-host-death family protein
MPSVAQVRAGFADAVNRVAYGGERVLIGRRGKPIAVIVDMTDYAILLDHEARQDEADVAEAARILEHPERHRWQTLSGERVAPPRPRRRRPVAKTPPPSRSAATGRP